ncbi:hypothetical protein K469DRAFT_717829 [Zopfia rhizophila CBS 207.26]|uniref:BED-type domain-containing protein n=1 Tax=Zopfia rhizophila CBS 207.26 TaxID=1314779 RepID=A0A6A6DHB1_9PEZI|nr:hypothetical protein K469DRAFT_717829 [Zopfia rhizophila CBS 207.26]
MAKKGAARSVKWEDVVIQPRPGKANLQVTCRFCAEQWFNSSVSRIEDHMLRCRQLPLHLFKRYKRTEGKSPPRKKSKASPGQKQLDKKTYRISQKDQEACDRLLAEVIYSSSVPFALLLILEYASHIVNLTIRDILNISLIKNLLKIAVEIVKYFKYLYILVRLLNEKVKQLGRRCSTLQIPVKSLINNKDFIKAVVYNLANCLLKKPVKE